MIDEESKNVIFVEGFPRYRSSIGRLVALVIVIMAMIPATRDIGINLPMLAVIGLVLVQCLDESNTAALGLRITPIRGWIFWIRMGLCFGLVIALLAIVCVSLFLVCGWKLPNPPETPPSFQAVIFMCIEAPFSEEVIFRILLTTAILPTLGERGTILVGGLIFGGLHLTYGNPGVDNQIAGFMLVWAFLKSRTILVPLALHSAGNLIAVCSHFAAWSGSHSAQF